MAESFLRVIARRRVHRCFAVVTQRLWPGVVDRCGRHLRDPKGNVASNTAGPNALYLLGSSLNAASIKARSSAEITWPCFDRQRA